jgi:hypothetical protein
MVLGCHKITPPCPYPPIHAFRPPQGGPTARPDPQIHPTGSSSTRAAGVNHPPDSDFGVKNRSNYPPLPSGQTDTAQLGLESIQSGLRHLLGDPRRGQALGRSRFGCFGPLFGHFWLATHSCIPQIGILGPKTHFWVTFHSFPRGYPGVPQKDTAQSRQKDPEVMGFGVPLGGGSCFGVTLGVGSCFGVTFGSLSLKSDDFSIKPSRFAVM